MQNLHAIFRSLKALRLCLRFVIVAVFCFVFQIADAQEIDFGSYYGYTVSISELNPAEDLAFGTLIPNEGSKVIELSDAKVMTIEGVEYLDVYVDITADAALLKSGDLNCQADPSCSIPFTLQSAYSNRGQNITSQATLMTVASNIASARFQIRQRGNRPPGPPPTPVYEGYNPSQFNDTAYIYLYGSISIGNVDAGSYMANITITVNYE